MLQESLYSKLSGMAGVSALVGSRIYPMVIPQQAFDGATRRPCIVYSIDAKDRQVRFSGTDTLVDATVSIDCFATTYAAAHQVADAVRSAILDQSGVWTDSDSPQGSVTVQQVFIETERDLMDLDPGVFRVEQVYTIWYDEA